LGPRVELQGRRALQLSSGEWRGLFGSTNPATGGDARMTIVVGYTRHRPDVLPVIGIRRRSAVGKMVLGSNPHRILMDSPCPVLTVRAA
jgi:hypothetical protein